MDQKISFTLFRLKKGSKLWAFKQMASLPAEFTKTNGCTFSKMMGSGSGLGFNIKPNFGVYALMMVWKDGQNMEAFLNHHDAFLEYKSHCNDVFTLVGRAYAAHGTWDQIMPFDIQPKETKTQQRMVLTRASIKWYKLFQFWKYVPETSKAIAKADGRILSIGVGEWPWIQQATISLWESEEAMKNYAYSNAAHLGAIKKTKELQWYSEELFARFIPEKSIGNWSGLSSSLHF